MRPYHHVDPLPDEGMTFRDWPDKEAKRHVLERAHGMMTDKENALWWKLDDALTTAKELTK